MVFDLVWKGKKYVLKEVPIKTKSIAFDMNGKEEVRIDENGVKLKKVRNPLANGEKPFIYVREDGTVSSKSFKTIKGKAVSDLKKTSLMNEDKISIVDLDQELRTMVTCDHTYYLVSSEFKSAIKEIGSTSGLMYKPYVCTSRGFKAYKALIFYDSNTDRVILKCVRSDIRDIDMPENEEVKEVETTSSVNEEDIVC